MLTLIQQALLFPGIAAKLTALSHLYHNHGVTIIRGQGATLTRNSVVITTGTRIQKHLLLRARIKVATSLLATGTALRPGLTTWHCCFVCLSLFSQVAEVACQLPLEHVRHLEVATEGCGQGNLACAICVIFSTLPCCCSRNRILWQRRFLSLYSQTCSRSTRHIEGVAATYHACQRPLSHALS